MTLKEIEKKIRVIDVCAGAGGWACAADRLPGKPIQIVAAIDFAEAHRK